MSAPDDMRFERDPEDVACDLEAREALSAKAGAVGAAALYGEAANWIRRLAERLDAWEDAFFGHMVPPKVARRMVEDRAKAECRMGEFGVTAEEVAEAREAQPKPGEER